MKQLVTEGKKNKFVFLSHTIHKEGLPNMTQNPETLKKEMDFKS